MKQNELSTSDIKELIIKYRETKDLNIRNLIVEKCLYLCPKIAEKYAKKYDIDYEEVLSLTQEGLINAIEEFDVTRSNSFYAYVTAYMTGFVFNGIHEWNGLSNEYMFKFYEYCYEYETITGSAHNSIESISYAVQKLRTVDKMGDFASQRLWNAINLLYPLSYSRIMDSIEAKESVKDAIELEDLGINTPEFDNDELLTLTSEFMARINKEDVVSSYAISNEIKQIINKMLGRLRDRQKNILEENFGLNGKTARSMSDIGKEQNCTASCIQQMEASSLQHLGRMSHGRKKQIRDLMNHEDRGLYDDFNELGFPTNYFYKKRSKK